MLQQKPRETSWGEPEPEQYRFKGAKDLCDLLKSLDLELQAPGPRVLQGLVAVWWSKCGKRERDFVVRDGVQSWRLGSLWMHFYDFLCVYSDKWLWRTSSRWQMDSREITRIPLELLSTSALLFRLYSILIVMHWSNGASFFQTGMIVLEASGETQVCILRV